MTKRLSTPDNLSAGGITLQHIAERCGVTKTTVSRALRGDPRISSVTTNRIFQTANELGYNPAHHEQARRLALRKQGKTIINHVFALFFPEGFQRGFYFNNIFLGIMDESMAKGYGPLALHSPTFSAAEMDSTLWSVFSRGDIDGVIVSEGTTRTRTILDRLRQNPGFGARPIIALMSPQDGCSLIGIDDQRASATATEYLISQGHRHILQFVFPEATPRVRQRTAGIKQVMETHGLDPAVYLHPYFIPGNEHSWMNPVFAPATLSDLDTPDKVGEGTRRFGEFMRLHPEITAVLALNDSNALNAWRALHLADISVPEQVSIVGFDDTNGLQDDDGHNLLTSLRVPLTQIGEEAVRLLVNRITGETAAGTEVLLSATFMERNSVWPVRA